MFRSIRWRLVASYVLLTLLAVSVVGVLALSLMRQYLRQQEREYLTANAEAVARQALLLMEPELHREDLSELARAASFLGHVQVRVLNSRRRVVADSGYPAEVEAFVWIGGPMMMGVERPHGTAGRSIVVVPHNLPPGEPLELGDIGFVEELPPQAGIMILHRTGQPWGSRFVFGPWHTAELTAAVPVADAELVREPLAGRTMLRSDRVVTVPVGEAEGPSGYVELSMGPDFTAEALATATRAFLYAAGGATLLAAIVGLLVSRGLTSPLRDLTATANRMTDGDLSIRAPVRGGGEIGQLARQFNHMAERLEASFSELAAERDSLRHFIADASHALRTPVTALRSFNELLQGAAAEDVAARAEFLAEGKMQLDRLEWVVSNLLDLSRLEAGLVALDLAGHDAGELIGAAAAAFKTPAREKEITLSVVEPSPPVQIHCDRARIELALSNLLDNALKFTPPAGRVEIGAEQVGEGVRLWVQDNGPGIVPTDQERIFERFYRGPDSSIEGSGLGLAIVRGIVQAHGGSVAVRSEPGTGSRFVIELPPAARDE